MEALLELYDQLLSHLNAEDNGLAEEFKEELIKYLESK